MHRSTLISIISIFVSLFSLGSSMIISSHINNNQKEIEPYVNQPVFDFEDFLKERGYEVQSIQRNEYGKVYQIDSNKYEGIFEEYEEWRKRKN